MDAQNLNPKHENGVSAYTAKIAGLPKRWIRCPKYGQVIQSLFLSFKTPLSEGYDELLEEEEGAAKFYPQEIFESSFDGVKEGGKIKLWINLANTERFYGWKPIASNNCRYLHMPLRGFNETPGEEDVDKFIEVVESFKDSNPNDIIAVHCTHGFNRTGFLIVGYLVKSMKWEVKAAVEEFAKARPNGIYKDEYLQELWKRYDPAYHPENSIPFTMPGRPEWDVKEEETDFKPEQPKRKQWFSKSRGSGGTTHGGFDKSARQNA